MLLKYVAMCAGEGKGGIVNTYVLGISLMVHMWECVKILVLYRDTVLLYL